MSEFNENGMSGFDALFNKEVTNGAMSFLNETPVGKNDGQYRIDFAKVSDKRRGWRAVLRLLPNIHKDGSVGENAVSKVTHYVAINQLPELRGYYDSPKNYGEKCLLSDAHYKMKNSDNALLVEKAKQLKYSKNYFSYALIVEDEQQPEMVGKIVIFKYGVKLKEKIDAEWKGEISGERCNIFDPVDGKDLVLIVTSDKMSIDGKEVDMPNYDSCAFRPKNSSVSMMSKDGTMKPLPVENGKIAPELGKRFFEHFMNREHEISEFEARRQTEEEQLKVTQIVAYLTGAAIPTHTPVKPTQQDFSFDDASNESYSEASEATTSGDEEWDF